MLKIQHMEKILLLLIAASLASCSSSFDSFAPAASPPGFRAGRQIERSASMDMKSHTLKKSSEQSIALVAQHNAYITNSSLTENDYSATIRVPSPNLSPLMDSLKSIGHVTYTQIKMDDVTGSAIELRAQLKTKQALRARLRALLNRATKVSDIVEIEEQLSRVQTEIDQLESALKSNNNKVAHATLDLDIERNRVPGPLGIATKSTGWVVKKLFHLN